MPKATEILCVAGLTPELSEAIRGLSQADRDNYDYIIQRPLTGRKRVDAVEATWYVRETEKIVGRLSPQIDIAILVACVDLPGHSLTAFAQKFFPFGLSTTIPAGLMYGYKGSGYTKRHANSEVRERARQVLRSIRALRKVVNQVRSATDGHRKKIPFILPCRNFRSSVLIRELEHLSATLPVASNPIAALDAARLRIDQAHPEQRVQRGQYRADDGDLQFAAPRCSEWHGQPHAGMEAHEPQCFLNNRSRLGGITIDGTFHFDCQDMRGQRTQFTNCHDHSVPRPRASHINIGTNDAIR